VSVVRFREFFQYQAYDGLEAPFLPPLTKPSNSLKRRKAAGSLSQHRDRVPLGFEDGMFDVTEVLAVDMKRERDVAGDLDPVEVVLAEEVTIVAAAAEDPSCH